MSPTCGKTEPPSPGSTKAAPQFPRADQQPRKDEASLFVETALRCLPSLDDADRARCRSENSAPAANHRVRGKSRFASRPAIFAPREGPNFRRRVSTTRRLPDSEQRDFAAHPGVRDKSAY